MLAARIKEIVIFSDYHDTLAEEFFNIADVHIKRMNMPENNISYDLDSFPSAKKNKEK